jgi:hypothetical protein
MPFRFGGRLRPRGQDTWGCADILALLAANIDARQFNPAFPKSFPRFVQSAIWRYCAENGLDICNGNRIDDDTRCDIWHCQLFRRCDRIALRNERKKIAGAVPV